MHDNTGLWKNHTWHFTKFNKINYGEKRNSQAGSAHCLPPSHSLHWAAFVSLKYPGGQIVGPSVVEGHLLPGRQMVHLIWAPRE